VKKLWLVAVAGLALSTSVAFAADLGQPAAPLYKAPAAPPPPGHRIHAPMAPALCNADLAATGKRIRCLC
jgi:hypothetical protein